MSTIDGDLELEIAAVKREIGFREYVYPRRIGEGKMTREKADHELRMMVQVLARLEALRPKDLFGG